MKLEPPDDEPPDDEPPDDEPPDDEPPGPKSVAVSTQAVELFPLSGDTAAPLSGDTAAARSSEQPPEAAAVVAAPMSAKRSRS